MVARVGTLAVGTRFVTLATGREGRVCDQWQRVGMTVVRFADQIDHTKGLHPDVRVRVVEMTH